MTISIGIPAFNEAQNISYILESVLSQKLSGHEITSVFVVSDGSTDETVNRARAFSDSRIVVVEHTVRLGKAFRLNEIAHKNTSDVLVLLDADVIFENENSLQNLIEPFSDPHVGLVSGEPTYAPPVSFFERALALSIDLKNDLYSQVDMGNSVYCCHGRVRGFSRKFLAQIVWPSMPGEDAFSYFSCITSGFAFRSIRNSRVIFRLPQNFSDYVHQSTRFYSSRAKLETLFGKNLVSDSFRISQHLFLSQLKVYFFKFPLLLSYYFILHIIVHIMLLWKKESSGIWTISTSSKKVV